MTELGDESEDRSDEQKARRSWTDNRAVMLGAVVAIQIIAAVVLTQFVIAPRIAVQTAGIAATAATAATPALPEMGVIVGLQEIIVTLQSEGRLPRYLKIEVNLEVANEVTAELAKERLAQLRDIVIMAASARSATDMQSPEGKQAFRKEIYDQLTTKLPHDGLRNVYFSDLVIQ